jgi:hypothetical protein
MHISTILESLGKVPRQAWRVIFWAFAFIVGAFVQIHGMLARRKAGEDWNSAIANGTKLITGNVWLDGAIFAAILCVVIVAIGYIFKP